MTALSRSKTIIYSCGSLYTSIILASAYAVSLLPSRPPRHFDTRCFCSIRYKIGKREEWRHSTLSMPSARRLTRTIFPPTPDGVKRKEWKPNQLISHLVYFPDGQVKVDTDKLEELGIKCIAAESRLRSKSGAPKFDEESVRQALLRITTASSSE